MAIKMYKKSKLQYKNGYVVDKKNRVVPISNEIVDMFNQLEEDFQRAHWNAVHPVRPAIECPDFEFETERGKIYPTVEAKTTNLDEAVEKAKAIMDDIDNIAYAQKVNDYLENIQPLIEFANDKRIVATEQFAQHRFDLKFLGNPLELTKEAILNIVCNLFEE